MQLIVHINIIPLYFLQRTGLLSMLDVECSLRGCSETYIQKIKVQHKDNKKLFSPNHCDLSRTFGIHHYAGSVIYDSGQFLDTNKDTIPDDLICVFAKENCNFGFASHLFGNEIRSLGNGECHQPRGATFRISPTSTSHANGTIGKKYTVLKFTKFSHIIILQILCSTVTNQCQL